MRRYYRLSDTGADELATEPLRLNTIAAAAGDHLNRRRTRLAADGIG